MGIKDCEIMRQLARHLQAAPVESDLLDLPDRSPWEAPSGLDDPDIDALYQLAYRQIIEDRTAMVGYSLQKAFEQCESPIEKRMLGALLVLGFGKNLGISVGIKSMASSIIESELGCPVFTIHIVPQYQLAEYRVDFLLRVTLTGCKNLPGGQAPKPEDEWSREINIVVECDGHNFHERTPEQAEKDRSRDRALQQAGFMVFRFTGREIKRDCWKCASDVYAYLEKQYELHSRPDAQHPRS